MGSNQYSIGIITKGDEDLKIVSEEAENSVVNLAAHMIY